MLIRYRSVVVFIALIAFPGILAAKDASGDWIGELSGPFDAPYTAQYQHVTLNATGAKLSGEWGPYKLAGALTGSKVDITLTDAGGKPDGTLTGAMTEDTFSGNGSVVPARRNGA